LSFFLLSKLLGVLADPLNLVALFLVIALLLLRRGRVVGARRLLAFGVSLMLLVTLLPVGEWLLYPLEQRFPPPASLPAKVDGIIMLGGAQLPRLTAAYHQPALNAAAERVTTFLALARRYPEAKLVFSGGSGDLLRADLSEAQTVRLFLEQQGFDAERVIYESTSRNTYENVVNSKQMLRPEEKEIWLLAQSAADIPRTIGIFNKLGWRVIPVPCDYNALAWNWLPSLSMTKSFVTLDRASHEWIGLVVYYLTDKTDSLFPKPQG
jgi:uncharacterized SAM-binding protein YcdF (DUF218 family)